MSLYNPNQPAWSSGRAFPPRPCPKSLPGQHCGECPQCMANDERPDMTGPWRGGNRWASCPLGGPAREEPVVPPMKATLVKMALDLSASEVLAGRKVMVLFPDCTWTCLAHQQAPPNWEVLVRATTYYHSVDGHLLDTLILVARGSTSWSERTVTRARLKLVGLEPRIITVGEKP